MQSHLILFLIGLSISCGALLVVGQSELNAVLNVLERFGQDGSYNKSGLTYDQYEMVFGALNEHCKRIAGENRDQPRFRILQDFILTPMERWRPSDKDDDGTKEAYVNRMERAFKLFYPAYVGSQPIGKMLKYNAKQLQIFLDSMEGTNGKRPTLAMWREALEEYKAMKARIEEIVTLEDVYEHLNELELKINFINDYGVYFMMENFADRLNECKSDADLEPIVADYRREWARAYD